MGQFQDTIYHEHPVVIRDVTASQFAAQAKGAPKSPGIRYRVDGGAEYQWNGSAWVAMVTAQQSVTGGIILADSIVTLGTNPSGRVLAVGSYNQVHPSIASSLVSGGTDTQPNYVGKKFHRFTSSVAGATFAVDLPFTLSDPGARIAVRAKKRRAYDGAVTMYDPATSISVAGYNSASLSVTVNPAVAAGEELEITVISTDDDSGAVPKLNTIAGYDNASAAIMSNIFGAHSLVFAGAGHATICGGSNHRVAGGYNTVFGGTSNDIGLVDSGSASCSASGQSVRVDGTGAYGFGMNLTVRGNGSGAIGRNCTVPNLNDAVALLNGAMPLGPSEIAFGVGRDADAGSFGLRQQRVCYRSADTADATATYLTDSSGTSEIPIPANSAASVRVEVVAIKTDGTAMVAYAGNFLVSRVGTNAPLVNGSAADVVVPAVSNIGAPTWVANLRGITTGLRVRCVGAAGTGVRWMATVSMTCAKM